MSQAISGKAASSAAGTIYQTVTDKIIAAIKAGAGEWRMPWHRLGTGSVQPVNLRGTRYRGANTILLWCAQQERGYDAATWGTYRAWQEKGAQVRKGEKATTIMFWKSYHASVTNDAGESEDEKRLVARGYAVFNLAQVDGYTPKQTAPVELPLCDRIARAESFFARVPVPVQHGGDRAFYAPSRDIIVLPEFHQFKDASSYYSTRGHESGHATGHPSRLKREFGKRFGDMAYSWEELTAEICASYIAAHLGIDNEPRQDHAQYLSSWLKVMRADCRAIISAASKAQAAADWIIAAAGESATDDDDSELQLAA
jgi:antirestriction protein ArdC